MRHLCSLFFTAGNDAWSLHSYGMEMNGKERGIRAGEKGQGRRFFFHCRRDRPFFSSFKFRPRFFFSLTPSFSLSLSFPLSLSPPALNQPQHPQKKKKKKRHQRQARLLPVGRVPHGPLPDQRRREPQARGRLRRGGQGKKSLFPSLVGKGERKTRAPLLSLCDRNGKLFPRLTFPLHSLTQSHQKNSHLATTLRPSSTPSRTPPWATEVRRSFFFCLFLLFLSSPPLRPRKPYSSPLFLSFLLSPALRLSLSLSQPPLPRPLFFLLQAWAASPPASSTPWPPSTSPAGATASATSTACSSRPSTPRGASRSCPTSG